MPQPLRKANSGIQYRPKILIQERPQHAAGIGLVAVEWAALEKHLIEVTAFSLFELTDYNARKVAEAELYTIPSHRKRLEFIASLLEIRRPFSGISQEFAITLKPELQKRATERNRIMHGYWGIVSELPNDIILITADNKHKRYSVKDFDNIADRIIETSNKLATFMFKFMPRQPYLRMTN